MKTSTAIRVAAVALMVGAITLTVHYLGRWGIVHNTPLRRIGSYDVAAGLGAVTSGWIPPWVPPSAVEIAERHGAEGRYQRLGFRIPVEDVAPMVFRIRMEQFEQITADAPIPEDLVELFRAKNPTDPGTTCFGRKGFRGRLVERIVVESATGKVFYWADPAPQP